MTPVHRLTLEALDWFFMIFHTGLVLFNIGGWAFAKTRRLHLITMAATLFSWLVMGLWKGVGYCICTDWHWQVRQALGYRNDAGTYIQFLVQRLTGYLPGYDLTRVVSAIVFIAAALATIYLNLQDLRRLRTVRRGKS